MTGIVELLAGPILGTIGTIGGRMLDLKAKKQDYEFELKKFSHEIDMRKQERIANQEENEQAMALNAAVTESEIGKTIIKGSYDGLVASINAEANIKSYKWVDAVRGLVRPTLTLITGMMVGYVAFTATGSMQEAAVASVTTQFGMAMAWWFGDRPSGQFKTRYQK